MAQIKTLQDAIDYIRPEARELVTVALEDKTTKDGYGSMMSALSKMPDNNMKKLLLIACVEEGYPKDTAEQLARIFGLS